MLWQGERLFWWNVPTNYNKGLCLLSYKTLPKANAVTNSGNLEQLCLCFQLWFKSQEDCRWFSEQTKTLNFSHTEFENVTVEGLYQAYYTYR